MVEEEGGEVLGAVRHPLSSSDFSSYLLQAQGSGAKVIGLANAGSDTTNSIKQAHEFGITQAGQQLAALLLFLTDVHALGLDVAQGLVLTTGFYWDHERRDPRLVGELQRARGADADHGAGGRLLGGPHYLQAIKDGRHRRGQGGGRADEGDPDQRLLRQERHDPDDGRMVHDMYLARVKTPDESKGEWDYYKILRTIPGDQAFLPVERAAASSAAEYRLNAARATGIMFELIGIPPQVLFGQLLLGLINGSFYAMLSLGLAVIFGMLNVINFAHGALYMMGAFVAYFLLEYAASATGRPCCSRRSSSARSAS